MITQQLPDSFGMEPAEMPASQGTESLLTSLLPHWPGVMFRQRPDFRFEFVSPRIEEFTGVPAAGWVKQQENFWPVVHEADLEEVQRQIKCCVEFPDGLALNYRVRHALTGHVSYLAEFRKALCAENGQVTGYVGFWLDVTRQNIAERRLAAAGWKETLAVLTLGLGHDFNNVIAGILALTESFLAQIDPGHPFHEGLSLIKQNAYQASQLVLRIIHLHKGRTGERAYQNLNDLTTDTVELLHKVIPRRIEIEQILHPTALPCYVDMAEFRQVLINLALNAADAMPDRGRLQFRTSLHHEFPPCEHLQGTMPRLPCLCLSVEDNGCGIQPHHLSSIFDPFFTTKAMNKGSGLGLYNARQFVDKHHGAISVSSTEGVGTTFCLWLPQADFTEADQAQLSLNQRRRCVLLAGRPGKSVDDTAEFLRLHNYQVVMTHRNALALLYAGEYHFDALMVLVESGNLELARLLTQARQSRLPVKTVLQIVGCNQDELETQFLVNADLVLSTDLTEEDVLHKLAATLEDNGVSAGL